MKVLRVINKNSVAVNRSIKILILQNKILHYRKALFNHLSKIYNVTVLHSGNSVINSLDDKFNEIIVPNYHFLSLNFQKGIFSKIKSNNYDIIITMCDLHWINNIIALFILKRKVKFILWGSWFTGTFIVDKFKIAIANYADANIFYSEKAKLQFIERGLNPKKSFTANNTFDVGLRIKSFQNPIKNKLLFVGSLDRRKQLDKLIYAYSRIINRIDNDIKLIIIGDGKEKEYLEEIIIELNLTDKIILPGIINEPSILKDFYKEAIASISYGQAGLSILQSLGFGVPFITHNEAISGGEIFNIIHEYNGFLCKSEYDLEKYIVQLCNNIAEARLMGENSYNYYSNNCTIKIMAQGFIDSINYCLINKNGKHLY